MLNSKFSNREKYIEDPKTKEEPQSPTLTTKGSPDKENSAPLICEYNLDITYPLTIVNCLPSSLQFKLSHLTTSMLQEPDSFSRVTLSRIGSILLPR